MPQMQMEPTRQTTAQTRSHTTGPSSSPYTTYGDHAETARQKSERQQAERERQASEQRQAVEREKAERKRLEMEREKLLASHRSYIQDQWGVFQRSKHDAPPALLPLEAARELKAFRHFLAEGTVRKLEQAAIDVFEAEISSQAQESERAVERLEQDLKSTSVFAGLLHLMTLGKLRELLRKCVVSVTVPNLGSPVREAIAAACKFLRRPWSKRLQHKQQAMFSVHRCAGKTVIHVGSSAHGSVFITLPSSLEPETFAEAVLSKIKDASAKLVSSDSTLAVIDGDHQALNYQRIFNKNIVVRSVKDDCDRFAQNLDTLLERETPTTENTALHFGMPASVAELSAVFPAGGADWDLWSNVAPLWRDRANRHGFDRPAAATAQQVLDSLTTDKNVIVVIAHANERILYMPAPPPEGSRLSADQVVARRDEIAKNKPVVYLFCCETAEISNLKSFSEILLECGAAAVIAPQTKIDAERSVDFFEGVVQKKSPPPENSLLKIKTAERQSNYREMEVWLG
jgi:hypothetical protein